MTVITRSQSKVANVKVANVKVANVKVGQIVRDIIKTGKQLDALPQKHHTNDSEIVKQFFTKNPDVTFEEYMTILHANFPGAYMRTNDPTPDVSFLTRFCNFNYRLLEYHSIHRSNVHNMRRAFAYMVSQLGVAFWQSRRLSYANTVYDKIMEVKEHDRVQYPEFMQFINQYHQYIETVPEK
jgi:hypothetical protein